MTTVITFKGENFDTKDCASCVHGPYFYNIDPCSNCSNTKGKPTKWEEIPQVIQQGDFLFEINNKYPKGLIKCSAETLTELKLAFKKTRSK